MKLSVSSVWGRTAFAELYFPGTALLWNCFALELDVFHHRLVTGLLILLIGLFIQGLSIIVTDSSGGTGREQEVFMVLETALRNLDGAGVG